MHKNHNIKEAIILAGGFGTRLKNTIPNLPKPMAPIAGIPFLHILLSLLSRKGIKHVVLSLGYMAENISSYFGIKFQSVEITYVIEEAPLGTGGAVRLAMTKCKEDHIFIFNGDTFVDCDLDELEIEWQKYKLPIIVGCSVPNAERYGRLVVSNGYITDFSEKGISGPGQINAGCYLLGLHDLDYQALNKPFSLEEDFFIFKAKKSNLRIFNTQGIFIDIGIPEDFSRAQIVLKDYI